MQMKLGLEDSGALIDLIAFLLLVNLFKARHPHTLIPPTYFASQGITDAHPFDLVRFAYIFCEFDFVR